MPHAELTGDRIAVRTELYEADLIRQVPGARWNERQDRWLVPIAWTSCVILRGVFGPNLRVGPALNAWAHEERRRRVQPSLELRERLAPLHVWETLGDVDPWVIAGAQWMNAAGSGLLLDDTGVGKTVAVATLLRHLKLQGRLEDGALIVATNSMLLKWREELSRWAPELSVAVATGTVKQRREALQSGADVVVIFWQNTIKHSRLAGYGAVRLTDKDRTPGELNRAWSVVVADEAHRMKSPRAKQTRALWAIGTTAAHRWALTATIIANSPDDGWSLLHFADPVEWPEHTRYVDRFCETSWNGWGIEITGLRQSTMQEFDRCALPRWRRVPYAAVHPGSEPPHHDVRVVALPPAQRRQYDEMRRGLITDCDDGGQLIAFDPLVKVTRLWQLASSCLDSAGQPVKPAGKVDALLEYLEEVNARPVASLLDGEPEPVVVAASHRRLLTLVEEALPERTWAAVHGGVPLELRQRNVERFQAGEVPVLLVSYKAGGEGLTLTRSCRLVCLQDSWSALENTQMVGRLDRRGQERRVEVLHLVGERTIDRQVAGAAARKEGWLESFVRDRQALLRLLREEQEDQEP